MEEKKVIEYLAKAWNVYVDILDQEKDLEVDEIRRQNELNDFRYHIDACHRIIFSRGPIDDFNKKNDDDWINREIPERPVFPPNELRRDCEKY